MTRIAESSLATKQTEVTVYPNAIAKSETAASGGTTLSLVTTGEKYTWNNKSNLTIGTTATTAAAGNHTHATSIATSSGTNQLTMVANTKYALSAGGTSYIFTTPPNPTDITGTAANVTGTVAIANGGTGATTRLNACKALTNENVGTGATHFVTMTTSWGKFGYSTVANAKTVLGLGSAASKNVQMGTINLATTGTYYDVTFTTAFSAAPYVVADYYSTGTQVAGAFGTLKISTVTKNGFKVMQQGTTGIAVTVCWIAML